MTLQEYIKELESLLSKNQPTGDYMKGFFEAIKVITEELKELK